MKSVVVLLVSLALQSIACADHLPEEVDWPIAKAYIPVGFDDNDNAQIVVTGYFPSTCYRLGVTEVKRTGRELEVHQTAYLARTRCLAVSNAFSKTVDLGLLAQGDYAVSDRTSRAALGKLTVGQASVTPGPDDFPYAPVKDAIAFLAPDGRKRLMFIGAYTDNCMRIRGTPAITYYPDAIVVQPVIEMREELGCYPATVPFVKFYDLKPGAPDTFLLHVRIMNGQAINKVTDLSRGARG